MHATAARRAAQHNRGAAVAQCLTATLAVVSCGVGFWLGFQRGSVGPRREWMLLYPNWVASFLLPCAVLLLIGGAILLVSHRRRSLRKDGGWQCIAMIAGYTVSLAAPAVLLGFAWLTADLTGTSNSPVYAAFFAGQGLIYFATAAWLAWHRRWAATTLLVAASGFLAPGMILAAFSAACAFWQECI